MEKEIKIIPPDGYELDNDNSTPERIVFKLKNKIMKWEDLKTISGYYVDTSSIVEPVSISNTLTINTNRNVFTTKELAESIVHFAEYSQLLKYYENNLNDFIPIHKDYETKLKPIFDLIYDNTNTKEYYYLSLLIKLYNLYVGNYKPDFNDNDTSKYCICNYGEKIIIDVFWHKYNMFAFSTKLMAEDFYTKYKDLFDLVKSIL